MAASMVKVCWHLSNLYNIPRFTKCRSHLRHHNKFKVLKAHRYDSNLCHEGHRYLTISPSCGGMCLPGRPLTHGCEFVYGGVMWCLIWSGTVIQPLRLKTTSYAHVYRRIWAQLDATSCRQEEHEQLAGYGDFSVPVSRKSAYIGLIWQLIRCSCTLYPLSCEYAVHH